MILVNQKFLELCSEFQLSEVCCQPFATTSILRGSSRVSGVKKSILLRQIRQLWVIQSFDLELQTILSINGLNSTGSSLWGFKELSISRIFSCYRQTHTLCGRFAKHSTCFGFALHNLDCSILQSGFFSLKSL